MIKDWILGLKDYLHDIQHDMIMRDAEKIGCKLQDHVIYLDTKKNTKTSMWDDAMSWKEGNLWHYIQQRRISTKAGIK